MSTDHLFASDAALRPRQWPGERSPKKTDVDDANESPASLFLERFRAALLHSASKEVDELVHVDSAAIDTQIARATTLEPYTYPMALFSNPQQVTPSVDEVARLLSVFWNTFGHHIFIKDIQLQGVPPGLTPPYLQFAEAALAAVFSPSTEMSAVPAKESEHLFVTGIHLWIVMLEVDNREARLLEAVLAAALLTTYGILTTDMNFWKKSCGLLCNNVTIMRRLHLTDGFSRIHNSGPLMGNDARMTSSLVSYVLLIDTLQTVHCNTVPNFSTNELFIRMPASHHPFRKLYNLLTHDHALPSDVTSREDALLLLTALLSDVIYAQKCYLPCMAVGDGEAPNGPSVHNTGLRNPYAPLTSRSEYSRLHSILGQALLRWEHHFDPQVGGDVLALCHFARIQLLYPGVCELPSQVGYGRNPTRNSRPESGMHKQEDVGVPAQAVDLAWRALDDLDGGMEGGAGRLSIWLPIVVFMSGLVVWKDVQSQRGQMKVLSMFRDEISRLPWPCCVEMTATLDRLARS